MASDVSTVAFASAAAGGVPPMIEEFDVVIVGGGLAGLVVASGLPKSTHWLLVEAHPTRLGGRLLNSGGGVDLGAAWVWPRHQPHMAQLLRDLNLPTFQQPDDDQSTRVRGGAFALVEKLSSGLDATRIRKGCALQSCTLVPPPPPSPPSLSSSSSPSSLPSLGGSVCSGGDSSCSGDGASVSGDGASGGGGGGSGGGGGVGGGGALLTFQGGQAPVLARKCVVLTCAPRLLAELVTFDPPLPPDKWRAMEESRTWMAGVTKVALTFPERFWPLRASNTGLPGQPAFQVYDSGGSASEPSPGSLTFFALAPPPPTPSTPSPPPSPPPSPGEDVALAAACAQQLAAVWERAGLRSEAARLRRAFEDLDNSAATAAAAAVTGAKLGALLGGRSTRAPPPPAAAPAAELSVAVQRWPLEPFVAGRDTAPTAVHPHPHVVRALGAPAWGGRVLFAGTESDQESPGVMEGAVGAAKRALSLIEI